MESYISYSGKNNHQPTYKYHDDICLELTTGEMSCFFCQVLCSFNLSTQQVRRLLDENQHDPEIEGSSAAAPGGWVSQIQDSPYRSKRRIPKVKIHYV
jgi:hypothetical protein